MSSGPVGNGLSYFAKIQILGDLTEQELQQVVADLKAMLASKVNGKDIKGKIASQARVSDQGATVTLNATY